MEEKTVLVVEDDLDTRDFIGDLLMDAGHDVIPAGTGKQALDYLLSQLESPPDVVVLDLMLPLVSGWQVLERMRSEQRLAGVPVIVTTGISSDRPPGATMVLKKPFSVFELLQAIDSLTRATQGSDPGR
jgi:DNA-binding response OmpR family regulator